MLLVLLVLLALNSFAFASVDPTAQQLLVNATELYQQNRINEAFALFNLADGLDPTNEEIKFRLANVCYALQNHACSLKHFQECLHVCKQPSYLALSNFYLAVLEQHFHQNYHKAADYYEASLQIDANNTDVLYNFAALLYMHHNRMYRPRDLCLHAITIFEEKRSETPEALHGECYYMLGIIEEDSTGNHTRSIEYFEKVLELFPNHPSAHNNIGAVLYNMREPKGIYEHYRTAYDNGCPDCLPALVHAMKLTCRTRDLNSYLKKLDDLYHTGSHDIMPYRSLLFPFNISEVLDITQRRTQDIIEKAYRNPRRPNFPPRPPKPDGIVRIGFISTDFRGSHPTGRCIQDIFRYLEADPKIEVYIYSLAPEDQTSVTYNMKNATANFFVVWKEQDVPLAQRIYDDAIDILIDYNGHTDGSREEVLAMQPAPVQMLVQGYPGTMGAPYIQYMVGDRIVTPPEFLPYYSETVKYMPFSYHMFSQRDASQLRVLNATERAEWRVRLGLPPHALVLAHFNKLNKLDPDTMTLWMDVMTQIPNSVLWVLKTWSAEECMPNLRELAAQYGINGSRIVLLEWLPVEEHLQAKSLADLFLDSFDYNAHTTGVDVLVAGVPVLTIPGEKFASRVGASYLTAVGLPHLIAHSRKEFEETAFQYAGHEETLQSIRQQVRHSHTSVLWDAQFYANSLANVLKQIWHEYNSRRAPTEPGKIN